MQGFERLTARTPESVVFIEDDVAHTAWALRSAAGALSERMKQAPDGRIAVFSTRPTALATSLLASIEAGRELLIMRSGLQRDDPYWETVGVGAIVDAAGLQVLSTNASGPKPGGEAVVLIPTSGTSGVPKLSRHRVTALMGRVRPPRSKSGDVRWLMTYLPQGFAGLQILLTALTTESTLVCLSEIQVPRLAKVAVAHQVTHISGTPTFWRSFLLYLGTVAGRLELEQITLGGEVVDQATLDRLRKVFPGASVSHIYASTEAGALFSVRDGQAGFPERWLSEPVDGVSLRIRDGVLEVRSPRAMLGYLGGQAAPFSSDGWLVTGDRVEQRDGRVYFLGREDSRINIGGAKVTPEEVESALLDVPGVLDLRAFAAPNPITGFVMGLEVAAAPGADLEELRREIARTARLKLPSYQVPRLIRFVDAVRCDASGKKSRKAE